MNNIAPKDFVDILIAGFSDPAKAISALEQVLENYQREAETKLSELEVLKSRISRITELRDTFERQMTHAA